MYQESITYLKSLTKKPSVKQWTQIAQENNFLSVKSLLRLSGMNNFYELCSTVRKRKK